MASSQGKQTSASLKPAQRPSSSSHHQTNAQLQFQMAHGANSSAVPGMHHSTTAHPQATISSSSSTSKQGVHTGTAHTNRSQGHGSVTVDGNMRSVSSHRHGKPNEAFLLNLVRKQARSK